MDGSPLGSDSREPRHRHPPVVRKTGKTRHTAEGAGGRVRVTAQTTRPRGGPSTRLCAVLQATRRIVYNPATMTEDEREHLLSTVGQAHAGLSEVALKLRLGVPPNTPARKKAMKAERAAFELKRALQRLDVKDVASTTRREPLFPEVRRGGQVVDIASLLRHKDRHDEP